LFQALRVNPLNLGGFPVNTTDHFCQVVGWGNRIGVSPHEVVAVNQPQVCNSNFPQVFCSIIDIGSQQICTALQGSPVICGNNSEVSGIVISFGTCGEVRNQRSLDYHSVGEFREWIEEVSGAEKIVKGSVLVILSTVLMSSMNYLL
jgi:hypothetical protein